MQSRAALAAFVAFAVAAVPITSHADRPPIRRVPVQPPSLVQPEDMAPARPNRKARRGCLDVDRIAGAIVTSDRSIELTLYDGETWRMRFGSACPALSYYQGFYYRRTEAGRLCAGRDAVIARSGGECAITSLSRIKKKRKKREN